MKIKLNSIFVDDQDKALTFYTEVLGFKKSKEIPVGEFKWLTVTSPEGPAIAIFSDTCGNLIQLYQRSGAVPQ